MGIIKGKIVPDAVKIIDENLLIPNEKLSLLCYNETGEILYYSNFNEAFTNNLELFCKNKKIYDILLPLDDTLSFNNWKSILHLDSDKVDFDIYSKMKAIIDLSSENAITDVDGNINLENEKLLKKSISLPSNIIFPALFNIKKIENCFLLSLHPLIYFAERYLGRKSQDMFAVLKDDSDEILFGSNLLHIEEYRTKHDKKYLSDFFGKEKWKEIITCKQNKIDYYNSLLNNSSIWTKEVSTLKLAETWVEAQNGTWKVSEDAILTTVCLNHSYLAYSPLINHKTMDIKVEIYADLATDTNHLSLGVLFGANIENFETIDRYGHNFSFQGSLYTDNGNGLRLKKNYLVEDDSYMDLLKFIEANNIDYRNVKFTFEKIGAMFSFYVDDILINTMISADIFASKDNLNNIALIGGSSCFFKSINIYTRDTIFDEKLIPKQEHTVFMGDTGKEYNISIHDEDIMNIKKKVVYLRSLV